MNTSKKNILTILGFATAAFALYYLYIQTASSTESTISDTELQSVLNETQVFIARGQELGQMRFDFSVFEDAHFKSLRTFTGAVQEQPAGRTDPFSSSESSVIINQTDS